MLLEEFSPAVLMVMAFSLLMGTFALVVRDFNLLVSFRARHRNGSARFTRRRRIFLCLFMLTICLGVIATFWLFVGARDFAEGIISGDAFWLIVVGCVLVPVPVLMIELILALHMERVGYFGHYKQYAIENTKILNKNYRKIGDKFGIKRSSKIIGFIYVSSAVFLTTMNGEQMRHNQRVYRKVDQRMEFIKKIQYNADIYAITSSFLILFIIFSSFLFYVLPFSPGFIAVVLLFLHYVLGISLAVRVLLALSLDASPQVGYIPKWEEGYFATAVRQGEKFNEKKETEKIKELEKAHRVYAQRAALRWAALPSVLATSFALLSIALSFLDSSAFGFLSFPWLISILFSLSVFWLFWSRNKEGAELWEKAAEAKAIGAPLHFMRQAGHAIFNWIEPGAWFAEFFKTASQKDGRIPDKIELVGEELRELREAATHAANGITDLKAWADRLRKDTNKAQAIRGDLSSTTKDERVALSTVLQQFRQFTVANRHLTVRQYSTDDASVPRVKVLWQTTRGEKTVGPVRVRAVADASDDVFRGLDILVDKLFFQDMLSSIFRNGADALMKKAKIIQRANRISLVSSSEVETLTWEPTINISVSYNRDALYPLEIKIHDNGPGIPRANRESIFEPYFTTRTGVGSGMGLYMAREYILDLGGRLTFTTSHQPPAGQESFTEFTIQLPADRCGTELPSRL